MITTYDVYRLRNASHDLRKVIRGRQNVRGILIKINKRRMLLLKK